MDNQLTPAAQHRSLCNRRRSSGLATLSMAGLLVLLPGCISANAPETVRTMNGEAMYAPQPWATSKPVNITARVNALQGALGAVQSASNSYVQYQQQRADAHNLRQARISAYKTHQYNMRLKAEEDARLKALLAAQNATPQVLAGKPISIKLGPAPTMADYADDIGNSMRGFAKSMRGWMAAGHPAFEYSSNYKQPAMQPRYKPNRNKD